MSQQVGKSHGVGTGIVAGFDYGGCGWQNHGTLMTPRR